MNIRRIARLIKNAVTDPKLRFGYLSKLGVFNRMSDEEYLKKVFQLHMGKELDLENPKTFNEKLQWLKLYDQRPEYTKMVDKYAVKKLVAEMIGEEYIIPTLGVWNRFEDIDFDALPDQFVLKCTHDSGGLAICRDKNTFDFDKAKKVISKSLKQNYYWKWREWPYKDVPPRIIAEKYMQDEETGELRDYKFFCFNGEAKALFIATERQKENEEVKFDFFDMAFNHLDVRQGHPNAKICPEKPKQFDEMRMLAEVLSKNIPQLRVDFYEVNGKVYFGELTFSHFAAIVPFEPESWDRVLGDMIILQERCI